MEPYPPEALWPKFMFTLPELSRDRAWNGMRSSESSNLRPVGGLLCQGATQSHPPIFCTTTAVPQFLGDMKYLHRSGSSQRISFVKQHVNQSAI
jgi:hypothetical protein